MSEEIGFTGLLEVALLSHDNPTWIFREELTFVSADGSSHTIPQGFVTDFASVPRDAMSEGPRPWWRRALERAASIAFVGAFAMMFWAAGDKAHYAAALHDYLYSIGYDRKQADGYFLEAMELTGINKPLRLAMHRAVRLFGAKHHNHANHPSKGE
jgi:hypothetical protein